MSDLLDRIRGALVGLKMPRALEALDYTLRQLETGEITAIEAIDGLLSEEYATRETRRIDVALRTAKLLPVKTLEGFDFRFQPSLDRERIAALAQLDFIRRAEVVHFLGPPGTGKSHLATALGVAAVKAGALLQKGGLRRDFPFPFPLQVQATRTISAVPRALKRFMRATRMWISAVCRSGSLAAMRSPKDLRQRILASARLRSWYPVKRFQNARP